MSLLSAARITADRRALEITLTHTATLTPMVADTIDSEGNTPTVAGSPVAGVRCRFETLSRVERDAGGTTIVSVPALTVSATQAIVIGTQVTAITDSLGGTPPGADGTFRVERVLDDTAGLGAALLPQYELRGARTVS